MAELLLSWVEWVEVEVQGFPDLLEGLYRLRGAVMKAAAVGVGVRGHWPVRSGTGRVTRPDR